MLAGSLDSNPPRSGPPLGARRPWLVPLLTFFSIATVLVSTWWVVNRTERTGWIRNSRVAGELSGQRLRDFVETRLAVVASLCDELRDTGPLCEPSFEQRSLELQQHFSGFRALNWVDPEGQLRIVVPCAGNEAALGRNVLDNPVGGPAFLAARDTGELHVTPAMRLFQGVQGLVCYAPVVDHGEQIGFVNGVLQIDRMVEASLPPETLSRFAVLVQDGDLDAFDSGFRTLSTPAVEFPFRILDRSWSIALRPLPAYWDSQMARAHQFSLWSGLVLALGLAYLVQEAILRKRTMFVEREWRFGLESRLRESEKLEALGRLAGGVAHDFNNVLTVILGNADLIRQMPGEASEELVEEIQSAAKRATDMTNQLLAYSRRQVLQAGPHDLRARLADLRGLLARLVREDVEFSVDIDPELWHVLGEPSAVERTLVNLVVNAVDAIVGQGTVRVRAYNRDTRVWPETAGEVPPGDWVVIEVSDTGIGISEEARPRIFEPFFSTKGNRRGTGLGLATVYGLVVQMGGHITLTSEVGVGSTFQVWLPRSTEQHSSSQRSLLRSDRAGTGRVLVVEDDDPVRRVTTATLRAHGFTVEEVATGEEALELAAHRAFDMLVIDQVLPGTPGSDVALRLREQRPSLGIVVCSGYAAELDQLRLLLSKDHVRFLGKPYATEDLLEALRSVWAPDGAPAEDEVGTRA